MSDGRGRSTTEPAIGENFDEVVLPHLDAAHRLACWLLRNEHDAEDAVQEASLRALRYFRTFTGGNGRAWFLRIVRNTCHGRRWNGGHPQTDPFDEERHSIERQASDPETLALRRDDARLIEAAMRAVPDRHRELLVLRELDGLSYRELADATGMPIGTVMSSLSRGRQALRKALESTGKTSASRAAQPRRRRRKRRVQIQRRNTQQMNSRSVERGLTGIERHISWLCGLPFSTERYSQ